MIIISILLFIACVACVAYIAIPPLTEKYSGLQKKRMAETTKDLDRFLVAQQGRTMLMLYIASPLVLGGLGFVIGRGNLIAIGCGAALGFVVPKIAIKRMAIMRVNKFQDQLVDGLMVLSSALKSGMSFNQALETLVEEMPVPLCEEFSLVLKENHMGLPLDECLMHLKKRMPLDDLGLIISAIGVARETGGDLTEIFSQLVFTIREKNKLERKVRTLTVQGRLQGLIMSLLPIAFAIFTYYVTPENFEILLSTRMGQMLLVYAIVSEILGVILIRYFSRVDV